MTHADDDVLATNGGPDDANTRAELAVLDMALHERFGDRAPRDLWPSTAERLARARTAASTRMHPWLLAAGMLLGLGVVTAIALWRPGSTPDAPISPSPGPLDPSTGRPNGPSTLAELRAHFAAADRILLKTHAVWSAGLDRWVPVRSPVFVDSTGGYLEQELTTNIAAAIAGAQIARSDVGEADMPHWSHRLLAGWAELLVRIRDDDPPQVGFMTPQGAVLLQAPAFPFDALLPVTAAATTRIIDKLGMVLGAQGFAAVPTTAKQLQLHDVPPAAIGELARYPALQSLDLTHAPAWHDATVLQGLERHHLAELALLPDRLDASAFRALGQLYTLRELSLADRPPYDLSRDQRPCATAANLDDTAMQALAKLQRVTQLTLAGGRFTDAGLRALQSMPLTALALFHCEGMRGESLAELRFVRQLILRCGPLGPTAAAQMAAMPDLTGLWLFDAAASIPLAPLVAAKKLNMVSLQGPLRPDGLPHLATIESLRDLVLRPTLPLTDQELLLLHGLRQLETLSVVGATEVQCQALRDALPRAKVVNVW